MLPLGCLAPMETATIIGYLASLCSMTSFTPQAWKIIKTRDTGAISRRMYMVTVAGFSLWLVFGVMKNEWPIILTNAVCLALSAFILVMKVMPRRQRDAIADKLDPEVGGGQVPSDTTQAEDVVPPGRTS